MSTQNLFGDDDSSSSEEEETKKQEPTTPATQDASKEAPAAAPNSPAAPNKTESDDDEDDPEFDDQGAVVGLSSTTLAGTKTSATPMQVDKEDESKEDEEPPKEPEIMVVQELAESCRPNGQEIYMTKLPNLIGIQPTAFDPETYSPETEEDDFGPQSSYNLMRWRYNETGERQSNTRMVQWDDGSWTLHVGKEAFEVDIVDYSTPQGFAGLNGYLYMTQQAEVRQASSETTTPAGTVLECLAPVTSRMTVRPSSLQSEAHKSLTLAVRQKTIKRARIAEFTTTEDPEKLKEERIKVKQDLEKAAMRKQSGYDYRRNTGRRPRMARSYLEEEEDEDFDTTNIRAMKKGIYDRDMDDFGDEYDDDDDEDEDEETFHRVRPKKGAKASKKGDSSDEDDDDEDIVIEDDEDDEDEVTPVKKQNKKRPAQSMFDDDDSD